MVVLLIKWLVTHSFWLEWNPSKLANPHYLFNDIAPIVLSFPLFKVRCPSRICWGWPGSVGNLLRNSLKLESQTSYLLYFCFVKYLLGTANSHLTLEELFTLGSLYFYDGATPFVKFPSHLYGQLFWSFVIYLDIVTATFLSFYQALSRSHFSFFFRFPFHFFTTGDWPLT